MSTRPLHTTGGVVLVEPGGEEHRLPPTGGDWTIGRLAECDLVLQDAGVSRRHAALTNDDGVVAIRDLGSANGTWVNGRRLERPRTLARGDRIRVGETTLVIDSLAEAGAARDGRHAPDSVIGTKPWYTRLKTLIVSAAHAASTTSGTPAA